MKILLALCLVLSTILVGIMYQQFDTPSKVTRNSSLQATNDFLHTSPKEDGIKTSTSPYIIAHQGSALLNPENTMMTHSMALELGADVLHVDLRHSKDRKLFIFHNDTARVPSQDSTTEEFLPFNELSAEQVALIDTGHDFYFLSKNDGSKVYPYRNKGLRVPDFLQWMVRYQKYFSILELQEDSKDIANVLIDELTRYLDQIKGQAQLPRSLSSRLVIASKYSQPLKQFRARTANRIATSCSEEESFLLYSLWSLRGLGDIIIHFYKGVIPKCQLLIVPPSVGAVNFSQPEFVSYAHRLSIDVAFAVVNEEKTITTLLQSGADGVVTDRSDIAPQIPVELKLKPVEELSELRERTRLGVNYYKPETSPDAPYECHTIYCFLAQRLEFPLVNLFAGVFISLLLLANFLIFVLATIFRVLFLRPKPKLAVAKKKETKTSVTNIPQSKKDTNTPTTALKQVNKNDTKTPNDKPTAKTVVATNKKNK